MFAFLLAAAFAQTPPTLEDVLRSVDDHLPLLVAAEAERDAARAQLLAARGWFDPTLQADVRSEERRGRERV